MRQSESVDGSHIEDVTISNITMRNVPNDPIFIRLGACLRGPNRPPAGTIQRINISNIVVSCAHVNHASTIGEQGRRRPPNVIHVFGDFDISPPRYRVQYGHQLVTFR